MADLRARCPAHACVARAGGGVCTSLRVRPPSISNSTSPQNREKSFTRRRKKRGASPLAERIRKTAASVFSKRAYGGKLIEVTGLHTR